MSDSNGNPGGFRADPEPPPPREGHTVDLSVGGAARPPRPRPPRRFPGYPPRRRNRRRGQCGRSIRRDRLAGRLSPMSWTPGAGSPSTRMRQNYPRTTVPNSTRGRAGRVHAARGRARIYRHGRRPAAPGAAVRAGAGLHARPGLHAENPTGRPAAPAIHRGVLRLQPGAPVSLNSAWRSLPPRPRGVRPAD